MTPLIAPRITVSFRDCDPLGHVNNAVYLTYLEVARFAVWRAQLGYTPHVAGDPGPRGEGFILARCEIDFRAQARFGDQLEVRLGVAGFGRTSCTYEYEVVNVATGALVAAARTVQVWFDYDAQTPAPLTEAIKDKLSRDVNW